MEHSEGLCLYEFLLSCSLVSLCILSSPSPLCALTVFLLVSMSSAVAPVPRPPNLLPLQPSPLLPFWLFMPPRAQFAPLPLSPSLQSLPSLYHFVCISIFPLSSCPSLLILFLFCFTASASSLLHYVFFSLFFSPLFSAALLSLHIWQHIQTTVLAAQSISQRV